MEAELGQCNSLPRNVEESRIKKKVAINHPFAGSLQGSRGCRDGNNKLRSENNSDTGKRTKSRLCRLDGGQEAGGVTVG